MGLANKQIILQDSSNSLKDQPYIDQPGLLTREQPKTGEATTKNSIMGINATAQTLSENHLMNKDQPIHSAASKNISGKQQHSKIPQRSEQYKPETI
jgi:hypothetical protein